MASYMKKYSTKDKFSVKSKLSTMQFIVDDLWYNNRVL